MMVALDVGVFVAFTVLTARVLYQFVKDFRMYRAVQRRERALRDKARKLGILVLVVITWAWPRPVLAQIPVTDIAALAKLIQQGVQTAEVIRQTTSTANKLIDIATVLAPGDLGRFRAVPIVPTTTMWDPTGPLAASRVNALDIAAEVIASMPDGPAKRQLLVNQALHFAAARTHSHAMKGALDVQTHAAGVVTAAIEAVTSSIFSGRSAEHQIGAILQKMAATNAIQSRQLDGFTRVGIGQLNELAVMQQRAINTDVSQMNMAVTAIEQTIPFGQTYVTGSADALRTWRVR